VNELRRLPASSSELSQCNLSYYASDADRFYASQSAKPVIIAVTQPFQFLLASSGRGVVIYEQGKIEVKWMTNSEFEEAWQTQEAEIKAFEHQRRSRPPNLP